MWGMATGDDAGIYRQQTPRAEPSPVLQHLTLRLHRGSRQSKELEGAALETTVPQRKGSSAAAAATRSYWLWNRVSAMQR